jgi:hypothetical protein
VPGSFVQWSPVCMVQCLWSQQQFTTPIHVKKVLAPLSQGRSSNRAVLPSSQVTPECPGQHFHSRVVTVLYITLYVGRTTVL